MDDLKYWLGFSLFSKIGPSRWKKIKNHFPSLEAAFKADFLELKKTNLEIEIIEEFLAFRKKIDLDKELEKLQQKKIKIITLADKNYPPLLREIYNPPPLLYYQGKIAEQNEFSLAVVGSRKTTAYGQQVTQEIVKELTGQGLTIISGLALGIDALAHRTALQAQGKTLAVLASGLDKIYPATNYHLAQEIIDQGGLLISEFPLGTPPLKHHFPQRNRLISGLSLGTLIIEAGEKSGALITAYYALEQNREIFAIPGNIYNKLSVGTNNLIKKGAKLTTSAQDILEELNLTQIPTYLSNRKIVPETPEEEIILKLLSNNPLHINELTKLSGLDTPLVNSTLILMEMKGKVKNLGGKYLLAY